MTLNKLKMATFTITLFISATLMFGLQPMVGKMLLPIVGGSPAGWIVALAFFQSMLLIGYFVAHALAKFNPIKHTLLYIILLVFGALFLPISMQHIDLSTSYSPSITIMMLLTFSVAIPFIAISATNSTIQRLFTISNHASAKDPYFLYASSNIGSFTGLLIYPFLIEPLFAISQQSYNWTIGYILLIAFTSICLLLTTKNSQYKETIIKSKKATWAQKSNWIVLSFIPSALLSAVTTHITTDIFSAPLIWIIPLSIYLLTFVIAFGGKNIILYKILKYLHIPLTCTAFLIAIIVNKNISLSLISILIHLSSFTVITLMLHIKLAKERPTPEMLTDFYLAMAIGGALGGIVNAFLFPLIFKGLYEYPIFLILSFFLHDNFKTTISRKHIYCAITGMVIIILSLLFYTHLINFKHMFFVLHLLGFILVSMHPKLAITLMAYAFFMNVILVTLKPTMQISRNFYGVIKVYNKNIELDNNQLTEIKYMQHGTTIHGFQLTDESKATTPTSYYFYGSPISIAIKALTPQNIAAIGVGAGVMNCYSSPNTNITFIEIDENVINIAKKDFTFLSKCGNGMPEIILGDGRLKIKESEQKFDMIAIDAFSSDTIPTHLITKEAFTTYLEKLNKDGTIIIHISNRYFDLNPSIIATASSLGLSNAILETNPKTTPKHGSDSKWIILTPSIDILYPLYDKGYKSYSSQTDTKIWTDDYVDMIGALKL